MTEDSPCIFCKNCYILDSEYFCYAVMRRGADVIELPFTDTRPCKMYKSRQERGKADEG